MSLKCIDKSDFNHKLAGLKPSFIPHWHLTVHLFFFSSYFYVLFNFPLIDTLVPLTELWICYPITLNYCLSSLYLSAFEVLPFPPARLHALFSLYVAKKKNHHPPALTLTRTANAVTVLTHIYKQAHRGNTVLICPSLTLRGPTGGSWSHSEPPRILPT